MRNELEKLKKEELINKILGLQEELQVAKNEIVELKDDLDFTKTFLRNSERNENRLKEENKYLKEEVKGLENKLENKRSEIFELVEKNSHLQVECDVQKSKNERGAGRKKKCSDKQINEILEARKENKSMRVIAKEFKISLGLVQKIINEHKED